MDARPPPSNRPGLQGARLRVKALFFEMLEKEGWQPRTPTNRIQKSGLVC